MPSPRLEASKPQSSDVAPVKASDFSKNQGAKTEVRAPTGAQELVEAEGEVDNSNTVLAPVGTELGISQGEVLKKEIREKIKEGKIVEAGRLVRTGRIAEKGGSEERLLETQELAVVAETEARSLAEETRGGKGAGLEETEAIYAVANTGLEIVRARLAQDKGLLEAARAKHEKAVRQAREAKERRLAEEKGEQPKE